MIVQIRLFAAAAQAVGNSSISIPMNDQQPTVEQVANALTASYPKLKPLVECSRWAVDDSFVELDFLLSSAHNLALIPPVSGG